MNKIMGSRNDCGWLVALAVTSLAFAASMTAACARNFDEIGHRVSTFQFAAGGRIATVDADGDGVSDLVFDGTTGSADGQQPVLFVLGKLADGSIGFKSAKLVADDGFIARNLAWHVNGIEHVLTVGHNGTVRDYSGWPLVEQRSFPVVANAWAAAVGDIDADGIADLVVVAQSSVSAYALDSGLLKWSEPLTGYYDVALAQLDADSALEIILGGSAPGIIKDGATLANEWQYSDGFGGNLVTGNLDASGGVQWAGLVTSQTISIFGANPWGPLWSVTAAQYIHAIATTRLEGGALDVILAGNDQSGSVHVYDSTTHQELFNVPNGGRGINSVTGADIDGDGIPEIVFAAEMASQSQPLITVADSRGGFMKWRFYPASNAFLATALGDVDGDGQNELIAATFGNFGTNGTVEIFDVATGISEWRSPAITTPGHDPVLVSASSIKLVPHSSSPGMDIILAGTYVSDGRIFVIDGVTMQTTLQIGQYATGPLYARRIVNVSIYDFDQNGVYDYVASSVPTNSSPPNSLIQIFSGVDGALLWSTSAFGAGAGAISDAFVVPGQGDADSMMVAVMSNGLRAVNIQSGLQAWTLAATNDGALYLPNGVNGPEFAIILNEGALTFYDAETRAYLRSFAMPSPFSTMVSVDGDVHRLVAAAGDTLMYVDGEDGSTKAMTDYLGPFADQGSQISLKQDGPYSYVVATASRTAVYRYRLDLDNIFSDSFD
jgi:hypothetical protein